MSGPSDQKAEIEELRNALKETVINLEGLIEQAERVLSRVQKRLDDALDNSEESAPSSRQDT